MARPCDHRRPAEERGHGGTDGVFTFTVKNNSDVSLRMTTPYELFTVEVLDAKGNRSEAGNVTFQTLKAYADGLSDTRDADGNWYYYKNDKVDTGVTTVAKKQKRLVVCKER